MDKLLIGGYCIAVLGVVLLISGMAWYGIQTDYLLDMNQCQIKVMEDFYINNNNFENAILCFENLKGHIGIKINNFLLKGDGGK